MATAAAVITSLIFVAWIIYRIARGRPLKAHNVTYGVACVAGAYTYAFFLGMDVSQLIKILASILLGIILIIIAALLQRRQSGRS